MMLELRPVGVEAGTQLCRCCADAHAQLGRQRNDLRLGLLPIDLVCAVAMPHSVAPGADGGVRLGHAEGRLAELRIAQQRGQRRDGAPRRLCRGAASSRACSVEECRCAADRPGTAGAVARARDSRCWSARRAATSASSARARESAASARVGAVRHQLGEHGVEGRRDRLPDADAAVETHVRGACGTSQQRRSGRSPAENRAQAPRHRCGTRWRARAAHDLLLRERTTRRPAAMRSCSATRSTPEDVLGDRVLHLQTRVHFQEVELARPAPARIPPCRRCDSAPRRARRTAAAHIAARSGAARFGRRGLPRRSSGSDAAVSTRARTGARHCRARRRAPALRCVAAARCSARRKRGRRRNSAVPRAAAARRLSASSPRLAHDAHALAATAGRRLDQQRKAHRGGTAVELAEVGARQRSGPPARHAARRRPRARILSPMRRIGRASGPMKVRPAWADALGEVGVLRQKAVARMDGVGAGAPRALR